MNLRATTLKLLLSNIGRIILSFVALAFFSREMGAAELGTFFLFQSALSFATMPADLGLRTGIEKQMSDGRNRREVLGSALAAKGALILPVALLILLARQPLNNYIGADLAPLLAVGIILQEIGMASIAGLRGEKRVSETAIFAPLRTAIWTCLGALLAMLHFEALGLVYAFLSSLTVVAILGLWRLDTVPGLPTVDRIKSLVDYSKYALIGQVGGMINSWMDIIILGFFVTNSLIGAYEIAWRVAGVSMLVSQALRRTIFPEANSYTEDKIPKLEGLIERTITPSLYIVIPSLVGVIVLGEAILRYAFSPEMAVASGALVVLLCGKVQRGFGIILISPMHALDRPDLAATASILGLVLNIVFNLAFIPQFGILGAAAGTTLAATVTTVVQMYYLRQFLEIRFPWRDMFWLVAASLIMGIVLTAFSTIRSPSSLIDVIIYVAVGGALYILLTGLKRDLRSKIIATGKSVFG
jgi:O-antigen/teichoic acid export membrane protein